MPEGCFFAIQPCLHGLTNRVFFHVNITISFAVGNGNDEKVALLLALFSGTCSANSYVYMGADALSNSSAYSLQYGFAFAANQEMDFGYDLDFTQWNKDIHSFGMNIKPVFHRQQFYLAPIAGMHYFNDGIDFGYSLGAEVGYVYQQITFKLGYKDVAEDFVDNDAFYAGIAIRFK